MNKSELVSALAEKCQINKAQSGNFLEAFIDVITESLKKDEKISITGFLTMAKVHKEARTGRNPQNGQQIEIPAKNDVKIKAGKNLIEQLQ